jgi:hypothetical protein
VPQPANLLADELSLVVAGPDASARLRAALVLGLCLLVLLVLVLMQLVHWAVLPLALVLSLLVWWGLSFELVVVPGKGFLRRRLGPIFWRTLDFGPRPRLVVWNTHEGDDLLIARTGDAPVDPETHDTFWVGAKNDTGLETFAAHANAEIERVSALPGA